LAGLIAFLQEFIRKLQGHQAQPAA
jgi:hypothetical protein